MSSTIRRRRNDIDYLKDNSNQWVNNPKRIQDMFLNHFQTIYQSSNPHVLEELDNLFSNKIPNLENNFLCTIPFEDEIISTFKQILSSKSPGLDGFTDFFYKHYWEIVKIVVIATIIFFHQWLFFEGIKPHAYSLSPEKQLPQYCALVLAY